MERLLWQHLHGDHCGSSNAVGNQNMATTESGTLNLWPNPNGGEQLYVELTEMEEGVSEVTVDLHDAFGKLAMSRTIAADGPFKHGDRSGWQPRQWPLHGDSDRR
jgi:hypothetical protein